MGIRSTATGVLLAAVLTVAFGGAGTAAHAEDDAAAEACRRSFVPASSFQDTGGNTHLLSIDCMRWYGIANGITQDRYAPEEVVRRDQMASFLVRALGELRIRLPDGEGRFTDLTGNVHRDAVERLAAAGIVRGTGQSTYGPALPVTRAQMATMLRGAADRFLTGFGTTTADYFADDDGSTHEGNINHVHFLRLVQGVVPPRVLDSSGRRERGLYQPGGLVRRDQLAAFLARLVSAGVLFAPGGRANPYPPDTTVSLRDGWDLELLGADDNANAEVEAHDRDNPPAGDSTYMIYRVRATYTGSGTSRFGGADRLKAGQYGYTPEYLGGQVFHASGQPCGDIPFPLPDPETAAGDSVEGNICFRISGASEPDADNLLPSIFDQRWRKPTRPHLGGDGTARERPPAEERAPYTPPAQ